MAGHLNAARQKIDRQNVRVHSSERSNDATAQVEQTCRATPTRGSTVRELHLGRQASISGLFEYQTGGGWGHLPGTKKPATPSQLAGLRDYGLPALNTAPYALSSTSPTSTSLK